MEKFLVTLTVLGLYVCLSTGCSPPLGGFIEPGIEDMVYYSDIVAVGRVIEIIPDPSSFGLVSYAHTYGAKVELECTYKGGVLPRIITIGEAGYIPGMCFSYDLELNKEYIIFLRNRSDDAFYVQSEVAEPLTRLNELTNVCDLTVTYPTGYLPLVPTCPSPISTPDCVRHVDSPPGSA